MTKSHADRIAKLEHEARKQERLIHGIIQRLTKIETALGVMRQGQQAQDETLCALERQKESKESAQPA